MKPFAALNKARKVIAEMLDIILRKPSIDSMSLEGLHPSGEVKGKIEFMDVTFSYPSRNEICVLNGLNLTVEPGEHVALVGSLGSGKSTIISLLLRHYDPNSGSVLLDGRDLRDLNVRWLRSKIGLDLLLVYL
jgi:ATP-binding cassette subfamily B (MDR/TAP) protein 1